MSAAPTLLTVDHDVARFNCGRPSLDEWLQRRALINQNTRTSRTYIIAEGVHAIGYYALASGGVAAAEAPGKIRRNMPDPIPVMILARLAIDLGSQRRGLGADLLRDAVLRTRGAAEIGGIRALLVHAIDDSAAAFYSRWGFLASPIRPMTLFLPLYSGR